MKDGNTVWCDGCGMELLGAPVLQDGRHYCCQDCADGLECNCKSEMERLAEAHR